MINSKYSSMTRVQAKTSNKEATVKKIINLDVKDKAKLALLLSDFKRIENDGPFDKNKKLMNSLEMTIDKFNSVSLSSKEIKLLIKPTSYFGLCTTTDRHKELNTQLLEKQECLQEIYNQIDNADYEGMTPSQIKSFKIKSFTFMVENSNLEASIKRMLIHSFKLHVDTINLLRDNSNSIQANTRNTAEVGNVIPSFNENNSYAVENEPEQMREDFAQAFNYRPNSSERQNYLRVSESADYSGIKIELTDSIDYDNYREEEKIHSSVAENEGTFNLDRPVLTNDIKAALFEVNTKREAALDPIELTITKGNFDNIKRYYLSLIGKSGSSQSSKYTKYLQRFNYVLDDDEIQLIIYPAYSKDGGEVGHNQSGDTSLQIKRANGTIVSFIFDAPSQMNDMDWATLRCFGDSYNNDCQMAMHAKLLFLLHVCSGEEFIPGNRPDGLSGRISLPDLALSLPYAWAITDQKSHKVMVSGDCNALIRYRDNTFLTPMSAGYVISNEDPFTFTSKYEEYYKSKDYEIQTLQGLEQLEELGKKYLKAQKNLMLPEGGISTPVTIAKEIDGSPVQILLVTDGATDNNQALTSDLISYMDNKISDNKFMTNIQKYMNSLEKSTSSGSKKDDFARPLLLS